VSRLWASWASFGRGHCFLALRRISKCRSQDARPAKVRGYSVAEVHPTPVWLGETRKDGAMALDGNAEARVKNLAALAVRSGRRPDLAGSAAPTLAEW
jgi:hypothetical protein